jgi:hypothetical protein
MVTTFTDSEPDLMPNAQPRVVDTVVDPGCDTRGR